MTIKKFVAKTKEDATAKAKEELGASCVIMNVRQIKPTGLFKAFKSSSYEVTAAIEETEYKMNVAQAIEAQTPMQRNNQINLSANENISDLLKNPTEPTFQIPKAMPKEEKGLEEKFSDLQNIINERTIPVKEETDSYKETEKIHGAESEENMRMIKALYNTLLDNEIKERYANQLIDEVDRFTTKNLNIDLLLANIYQKMILKFGQPAPIDLSGKKPKVIFFIGPTGVGKTTTIAKIASKLKVEEDRKIALLTADTYRIAAEEQLRTYANILDTPLTIIYSADEITQAAMKYNDVDVVLVDTAGFSHKSVQQKEDTKALINGLSDEFDKEVFLVLSATTKYRDLVEIADAYRDIASYKLIFTKLDETSAYGNIYNMKMYTDAELSYVTNGQNVPEDISVFDTQKVVKKLLGGN